MRLITLSLATLACLGLLAANGCPPQTIEETKLLASDGAVADHFGSASVSGNVAVVGAFGDDDSGDGSGSAYVYRLVGTSWIEEAKLLASDGASGDGFGRSVSVSGDLAAVGATGDDDNGDGSGSAYVYRLVGTNWIEEAKLLASDGMEGDGFGSSVSISGDAVLVGAPHHPFDAGHSGRGTVYAYRFDGAGWVEEAKLSDPHASGAAAGESRFGHSVALSGDFALIGAPDTRFLGHPYGMAYVYRFDGGAWVKETGLFAPNWSRWEGFGQSVALAGNLAVVGRQHENSPGSACVFRFDGANWISEGVLTASGGAERDGFAREPHSISVSGNMVVVGAPGDGGNPSAPGSVHIYRFDGTSWVETAKLLPSDGTAHDSFGLWASVSGSKAVVGAMDCDDGCGAAYVFSPLWGIPECSDGEDNDGDGLIDHPGDPGCAAALDTSEHFGVECDDGIDNDGDGLIDYADDPGCFNQAAFYETSACQDGVDNDSDGMLDFDGGLSVLGYAAADPDPQCNYAWQFEDGCGLGAELVLLLPVLIWLRRLRRNG